MLKIAEGTILLKWLDLDIEDKVITAVEIPASLKELEPYALSECTAVQEYRVDLKNEYFKAIDGVLFSADGTRLRLFPSAREGSYTVPMGTLALGKDAFPGNHRLKELILCEGITSIQGAFQEENYYVYGGPAPKKLVLSSTVRISEPYSITGVSLEEVIVAKENPSLYDVEGVLFSKENDHLLVYPSGRKQEHYDVPLGTKGIDSGAFMNTHLKSVSLPRSVKTIEKSAFSGCDYLTSVSLPITLTEIGEAAFRDCVHLQYVSVPPMAAQGREVFDNCPMVMAKEEDFGKGYTYKSSVYGIVSPENVRGTVAVRSSPSATSEVLTRFRSGTTVTVSEQEGEFYQIIADELQEETLTKGYIAMHELQICGALYGAFTPSSGKLRDGLQGAVYYSDMWVLPASEEPRLVLKPGQSVEVLYQVGQWYRISVDQNFGYIPTNQLTVYTDGLGDGKAYGIVVNEDLRDRLHLRKKPQKQSPSLGKYFSGTQVEILGEEGDWYHVKVDLQEGYMMKRFVERTERREQ